MLKFSEYGNGKNTLVLMHYLGGSQREWTETVAALDRKSRCVTVDLPGFGDSADIPGYTIQEMTGSLLELLAHIRPDRYLLVGHGMSGKVAMAATRLASEQHSEVSSPMGMILVSPSPPGPTPVGESKRKQWVEWLGGLSGMNTEEEREYAEKFIRESSSRVMPPEIMERAIDDILRMNPLAWSAWLEHGSVEDWTGRVGVIEIPSLVIAGGHDDGLGESGQKNFTLPYLSAGHIVRGECGHLMPLEDANELAALISNFMQIF